MIYDKISNISQYKGISKNLDTAINFIMQNDLSKLPLGKTEIDEDNVFVTVINAKTKCAQDVNFELHKKYLDLQTDITGEEYCEVCLTPDKLITEYDLTSDIGFYSGGTYSTVKLDSSSFAIFMANELHKPTLCTQTQKDIRKAIFKIADN